MAGRDQQQARLMLSAIIIVVVAGLGALMWFAVSAARGGDEVAQSPDLGQNKSLSDTAREVPRAVVLVQPSNFVFESPDSVFWYPIAASGSPQVFDNLVSSGFSQTPEGAAMAATHLYYRSSALTPGWERLLLSQATGAGVEVAKQRNALVVKSPALVESLAQKEFIVGWDYLNYSESDATIRVWYGVLSSQDKVVIDIRVVWQDGDWMLVVPENGLFPTAIAGSDFIAAEPSDVNLSGAFQ